MMSGFFLGVPEGRCISRRAAGWGRCVGPAGSLYNRLCHVSCFVCRVLLGGQALWAGGNVPRFWGSGPHVVSSPCYTFLCLSCGMFAASGVLTLAVFGSYHPKRLALAKSGVFCWVPVSGRQRMRTCWHEMNEGTARPYTSAAPCGMVGFAPPMPRAPLGDDKKNHGIQTAADAADRLGHLVFSSSRHAVSTYDARVLLSRGFREAIWWEISLLWVGATPPH